MSKPYSKAFTLIETVLAIAIGGIILTAASLFLYSISQLYIRIQTDPITAAHIQNVANYLEATLQKAEKIPTNTVPGLPIEENNEENTDTIAPQASPSSTNSAFSFDGFDHISELKDPLLTFAQTLPSPIFIEESDLFVPVVCALSFEKENGLFFIWQNLQDYQDQKQEISRTRISPIISSFKYTYYDKDSSSWKKVDTPDEAPDGGYLLPTALEITFTHSGTEETQLIYLPSISADALLF